MPRAKPEYAIFLSLLGVLIAIGVPAISRGDLLLGSACLALAAIAVVWAAITVFRTRG